MIKVLNHTESRSILAVNYIGNLSYIFRNKPFIAPITYYYDEKNDAIIGYSSEGHKISAMRKNTNVSLGVTEINSVNSWKSILAQGVFFELSGSEAKSKLHKFSIGVKDLIINEERRKLDFISEFSSKTYKDDKPIVFIIKIEEVTGRMRVYKKL